MRDGGAEDRGPQGRGPSGRTGRRLGPSTTRAAITTAALHEFAASGYEGASVRSIGRLAGVDPALIAYFFGSKRGLFDEVTRLPMDAPRVVSLVLDGERAAVGRRLARVVLETLADARNRAAMLALLRSASHDRETATLLRLAVVGDVLMPITTALDVADAELRAELALAQISGFIFARHIIEVDAMGASDLDRLTTALGGILQHCLTAPLGN